MKYAEIINNGNAYYSNQDLTESQYHSIECPGISKSDLDLINKNPYQYQYYKLLGNERKDTPSMQFGRLVHKAILETKAFQNIYVSDSELLSIGSRTSKKYKDALNSFLRANPLKKIICQDQFEKIQAISKTLKSNTLASAMLAKGERESSFFWKDPETHMLCKCRPDCFRDDGFIIEIKTTSDASKFERQAVDFRYHVQAAWYEWGVKEVTKKDYKMIFIIIETNEPYGIRLCQFDNEAISLGWEDARKNVRTYAKCIDKNEWLSYNVNGEIDIETISLPAYAFKRDEND